MNVGIIKGNVAALAIVEFTFDPASIDANTTASQNITVRGVKAGDVVLVNTQSVTAGIGITDMRVSANDTISITYVNATGSPVNPGSRTFRVLVARPATLNNIQWPL